jgi:hypothetical protein
MRSRSPGTRSPPDPIYTPIDETSAAGCRGHMGGPVRDAAVGAIGRRPAAGHELRGFGARSSCRPSASWHREIAWGWPSRRRKPCRRWAWWWGRCSKGCCGTRPGRRAPFVAGATVSTPGTLIATRRSRHGVLVRAARGSSWTGPAWAVGRYPPTGRATDGEGPLAAVSLWGGTGADAGEDGPPQ